MSSREVCEKERNPYMEAILIQMGTRRHEIDNAQEVDEAEATRNIAKKRWDGNNAGQRSWKRGQIYESADDALDAGHLLVHYL